MTMNVTNYLNADDPIRESASFSSINSSLSLLDFMVIIGATNPTTDPVTNTPITTGPFASECLLQVCVQTYDANETNTVFQENVHPDPIFTGTGGYGGIETNYSCDGFSMDGNTSNALQNFFLLTFTGAVRQQDELSPSAAFVGTGAFDALAQAIFHALNDSAPHTLDSVFDNNAKSMTRVIRTSNSSAPVAIGQATAIQLFVRIEWPWISLPVALLFWCLLFLVIIIIYTSAYIDPTAFFV